MRRSIGLIALVAIFAAMFEIGANYLHWLESGKLYFRGRQQANLVATDVNASRTKIHPYFGFMNMLTEEGAARHGVLINNFGFAQSASYAASVPGCCDLPLVDESAFVIGVFGNSIAAGLAGYMQSVSAFEARLRSYPTLAGRRIVILNFAMGGFHQPQEYFVLAYLAAAGIKLDLVLYYPAINEVIAGKANTIDHLAIEYPTASIWLPLTRNLEAISGENITGLLSVLILRMSQEAQNWSANCVFASCTVIARPLLSVGRGMSDRLLAMKGDAPTVSRFVNFPAPAGNGNDPYNAAVVSWQRSVDAMAIAAETMGARYVEILLPNPWVHPSGKFPASSTEAERELYGREAKPVARKMAEIVTARRKRGLQSIDATGLFNNIEVDSPSIFLDYAGHLGPIGTNAILDLTHDHILDALRSNPEPTPIKRITQIENH